MKEKLKDIDRETINLVISVFVQEVEYRAEEKMLKTGKLEGSHYAAMKQVAEEWKQWNTELKSIRFMTDQGSTFNGRCLDYFG